MIYWQLLRRFWWAVPLVVVSLWGAWQWRGKIAAEDALADYQVEQSRLASAQQQEIIELQQHRDQLAVAASNYYMEGRQNAETQFKPVRKALDDLRARYAHDRMRQQTAAGPDPVPASTDTARGPDATACTDQPGRIIDAAARVVDDLGQCEIERARLAALQKWVREVVARPP